MKPLLFSLAREFKLIFRNGISLYMVMAPALLAVVFLVVFGAAQNVTLKIAVDASVDAETTAKLSQIADIEAFDSLEKLRGRVAGMDSVAGITMENGNVKLLVEGNEGKDFAESMQKLVGMALGGDRIAFRTEAVEPDGSLTHDVGMISVLLFSLFFGGATVGLSIVGERESAVINAVAVSPLRLGGYVMTKLVPAILLSMTGMTAACLIMGKVDGLPGFLLLALCSIPVSGMLIFVLGAFAKNQIAAIGVLKLVMPLSLILPISAVFVSRNWHILYYIFPMYWQYAAIDAVNSEAAPLLPCLMTLAVGVPWFAAALALFRKKTKLKFGR